MTETHEETQDQWKDELEWVLAHDSSMTPTVIDEVLAEVAAHCAESGEHPRDAFGSPEEFAARTARERIPLAEQARRDWAKLSTVDYLLGGLSKIATLLVVAALMALVQEGLWINLTLPGVSGSLLLAVTLQLVWVAFALRTAARLRAAAAVGGGVAVLVLVTAVAFTALPHHGLGRMPTPMLGVAGVLLGLVAWRLESADERRRAGAAAGGRSADATADPSRAGSEPSDTEGWLRLLGDLLVGRHGVPRRRARELVTEARDHLAATGRSPAEEFGPLQVYALRLAENAGPRAWWTRDGWQLPRFCLAVLVFWLQELADAEFGWGFWMMTVALAGGVLSLGARLVRWARKR